ncbi:hypothetical protein D770_11880 [Flammeovirgaceae bacterium 311]|nr:hypothetical protein D770_11880 [Flammeovirgaceae bacterium 311]
MKYQKAGFLTIVALLLLLGSGNVLAKDYTYHTVFVYNFTRYIEWPSAGNETVIGIQGGDKDALMAFEKMAQSKSMGDRKYTVKVISKPEDAAACHVIFIPDKESDKVGAYSQMYSSAPKLIVTERNGLVKKGSMINFVIVDGKMRFELNQEAMDKTGLKVSSQLLSLAIVV